MPKERDLSVLPSWRYRELKYFCLGYTTKKKIATKYPESLEVKEVQIIELAVKEVCFDNQMLYEALLRQMTEGLSYSMIQPYCSQATFYRQRSKAFSRLDELQRSLYKNMRTKGQEKSL